MWKYPGPTGSYLDLLLDFHSISADMIVFLSNIEEAAETFSGRLTSIFSVLCSVWKPHPLIDISLSEGFDIVNNVMLHEDNGGLSSRRVEEVHRRYDCLYVLR